MKNKKITQRILSGIVIVLLFAVLLAPFAPSAKVFAGSPQLQSILDSINKSCKNMNKNTDTWDKCESNQNKLKSIADCSGLMFSEKNGKWSPKSSMIEDCQKKINDSGAIVKRSQKLINFIKSKCTNVSDKRSILNPGLLTPGLNIPAALVGSLAGVDDVINLDGNWDNCEGAQNTLKILGSSCDNLFERVDSGGVGTLIDKNWSYSSDQLAACQKTVDNVKNTAATRPGEGIDESSASNNSQPDCDATGSPLSWIICPIVDLGANMSDFILSNVVSPLLSNVPISTDPNDGGYLAWKSFRTIGNIVLIGTMLAVVYAQVRGDR